MVDLFLDWATVILPTVLSVIGVLVSIRAPQSKWHRAWRVGLVATGIAISTVTFWQQARSHASHEREVSGQNEKITGLNTKVAELQRSQEIEGSRRQQAEKDLAIIVQATGQATRLGVSEDLRKAPISISVAGGAPVNQPKMEKIAEFVVAGTTIRNRVPMRGASQVDGAAWVSQIQRWWDGVVAYVSTNCRAQALVLAADRTGTVGMDNSAISGEPSVQSTFFVSDRFLKNLTDLIKRPELCP